MSDLKGRIDTLAGLIEEYSLDSASWSGPDWKVSLSAAPTQAPEVPAGPAGPAAPRPNRARRAPKEKEPETPKGNPISSPMMGIYYSSPSPGSEPFVKAGAMVRAGDVVGLIEAMKVFNEITSPFTGTVSRILAESGQLVQPGDVLVLVE